MSRHGGPTNQERAPSRFSRKGVSHMQKNAGLITAILVIVALVVLFWAFRGRPAGETSSTAADVTSNVTPPAETSGPVSAAPTPVPAPAAQGTTVFITAAGFSPESVAISPGDSVAFTNSDASAHQVASNPHPVHTEFSALNSAVLSPGQTFTVAFPTVGTFRYHDHQSPGVRGTVVVQ